MKRSPLKRKTPLKRSGKSMKRSGIKQKSTKKSKPKSPHKKAKDKAWDAFSKYIRLRDAIRTTGTKEYCICVTCGKRKPAFGVGCLHAGHWLGGRKGKNLFEEHAVHGQCSGCNLYGSGQQTKYEQFMVETYGHEEMDRITLQANTPYTYTIAELEKIEVKYKERYADLRDS